jgi:hypothetical protein
MDKKQTTTESLTVDDVIRLLKLFSRVWSQGGKPWKAGKALVAAESLRLIKANINQNTFPVSIESIPDPEEASKVEQAALARAIFADIAKFSFPAFIQSVVDEMVRDANKLISYYSIKEERHVA